MQTEDLEKTIDEIQEESGEIKPIPKGEGMIAYRKYLWALWFLQKKIEKIEDYKRQVIGDIDARIVKERQNVDRIRTAIEMALEVDPIAENTKVGGKKLVLPDIASVSVSKLQDKVIIDDPDKVLDILGEEFGKVKVSLDTTKAKDFLGDKPESELPDGAHKEKSRTLSIRFKR
jgi:hypothetical protein